MFMQLLLYVVIKLAQKFNVWPPKKHAIAGCSIRVYHSLTLVSVCMMTKIGLVPPEWSFEITVNAK